MAKILVIDDDPATLDALKDALDYGGYEVKTTAETENIFEIIKDFEPDLILIDYLLEHHNGGEICHQIKNDPQTSHLPVIIVSGYTRVLLSLGTYGCDAILPKPFGLDELLDTVSSFLPVQESH